jgi:hypothetical protein
VTRQEQPDNALQPTARTLALSRVEVRIGVRSGGQTSSFRRVAGHAEGGSNGVRGSAGPERDWPRPLSGNYMSQDRDDEIPEQTSAPGGVRGKYFERYREGTNVVLLAPDVAEVFHDSEAVNAALRRYLSEHGAPPEKSAG